MSSTQFNKGPSYRLFAEVTNRLLSKYDPRRRQSSAPLHRPHFQKGRKDGIILHTLMNKLQPGSVPKINRSVQNWHQLENFPSFIKAMVSYSMNPVDLFEANDLFESGNVRQVQVSLLALMGTNKCFSQPGMTTYGTRRHLYDPKNHILPPMDHSTISLQMGINKCASQVVMTLGINKCDNSSMSLQTVYTHGANQSGQVFSLGQQIYDHKYCPQGPVAHGAPSGASDCLGPGEAPEYPP
uniref:Calponin-2 n=1 Tax=Gorilla gorilla gorilla TaxID=9595 RepID=A0A2I2YII9_GORGO